MIRGAVMIRYFIFLRSVAPSKGSRRLRPPAAVESPLSFSGRPRSYAKSGSPLIGWYNQTIFLLVMKYAN